MSKEIKAALNNNYKKTPIGRIPKEWEVVRVEDIFEVYGGTTPSTSNKEYWNGDILWVTPTDVTNLNGKIDLNETERMITEKAARESSLKILQSGTLLLTSRATIGSTAINSRPVTINQGMTALIGNEKIDETFYAYFFGLLKSYLEQLGAGSTFREVSRSMIKKLKIPIPPLPEQRKIAEILSTVDRAIQRVDEAIARTERLKRGLMQELLTRGIGHEEFKFSKELGHEIPEEWKVVTLIETVENQNNIVAGPFGSNLKVCDYRDEGVPIIRLQNIERNKFIEKDIKHTSYEKAKELSYHSYRPGDIVLAKLGDPIGKTCVVPESIRPGIVVADVVRIRVSQKKANTNFIEYILNSSTCFNQLRKETIGSTRPRVNISQVRNLKIPLPPLPEQQKIAEVLSTVDKKLELERKRKEKLKRIKKGLMNDLLTGKGRVRAQK
jgi:type I restriction enzyme S subunit